MASGHIRTRKTNKGNVYQVIIESSRPDPVTGKRARSYKTFHKKKDAEKGLADMLYQFNHGTFTSSRNMSVETLMNEWLCSKEISCKQTTLARYKEQVSWYILPKLRLYAIDSLDAGIIQNWVNDIYKNPPTTKNHSKPLSAKTVKNIFLNLKAALDYAVDRGLLSKNPCSHVNLPAQQRKEVEAFDHNEIKQVLHCAQGTDLYFPIYLLINTGMRRGELLGLTWKDIHIDDPYQDAYIEIVQTRLSASGKEIIDTPKSQSSKRKIFISENTRNEFLNYRTWCKTVLLKKGRILKNNDLVIIRSDGTHDSPNNLTKRWNNFLKDNNIRHLKLHGLRHTCATMLLENNVDIKTISNRLGHADTTLVLTTYGHSLDRMGKAAADTMDSIMNISNAG